MASNIIQLPTSNKKGTDLLGLYLRAGHNDQKALLSAMAEGENYFFGIVIDALNVDRQKDLRIEATKRQIDLVLDPKILQMSMPGGYNPRMADLPWGLDKPFSISDLSKSNGIDCAKKIVEFAIENNFTQILGPTHFIQKSNDKWLYTDIDLMNKVRDYIKNNKLSTQLIYSLSIPIQLMRDPVQRQKIIESLQQTEFDTLWLRIDNFGNEGSGEKTISYIEACHDFQTLKKPIIADYVGGLPGLGLLAFGAVGGISHGITLFESFTSYSLRKPSNNKNKFMPAPRVYIPQLDIHLAKSDAEAFLETSPRITGRFGCKDHKCGPNGLKDMIEHPARHFIHQRSNQVYTLSRTPESLRVNEYLENNVRRASDDVALTINANGISEKIWKKFVNKTKDISRFRKAMVHFAEQKTMDNSSVIKPLKLSSRNKSNSYNKQQ